MSTLAPPRQVSETIRPPTFVVATTVPPLPHPTGPLSGEDSRVRPRTFDGNTASRLRHDLFASVWDAAAYSLMVGVGESYFGAYALALGLSPAVAALMVTLPVLLGSLLQLVTPWGLSKIRSHKRWVVASIATQVLCLTALPLATLFINQTAAMIAFGAVSVYWAAGLSSNPPWNNWMEELIPQRVRTRFFAYRQRTSQACVLTAFVLGGLALQWGRASGHELAVFAGIFFAAATSRFVSGCFVASQSEMARPSVRDNGVTIRQLLFSGVKATGGGLVMYLLAMQIAVQISGPYFTPFLLRQEKLSYLTYMILIGIAFAGKVIAFPMWGKIGERIGVLRLMWAGGLAVVPISGLWVFSDTFAGFELRLSLPFLNGAENIVVPGQILYLCGVQLLSGTAWAGYELAMALMFLQGIPREQRTSMLTLYNFGNSAAMVAGGLLGATVLQSFGESHNTYLLLFVLSSCVRLAMVPLLARINVKNAPQRELASAAA